MKKYKKRSRLSLDDKILASKFDFCKNLKWFLIAPMVIVLVGVVILCTLGFNLGIDFTGGTNMTIFVDQDNKTVSVKVDNIESQINEVLKEYDLEVATLQDTTINIQSFGIKDGKAVIVKYQNDNSLTSEQITNINNQIRLKFLVKFGFVEQDVLTRLSAGETAESILASLENADFVQNGGVTYAAASAELMMKSFIALLVAIVLILIYVAFRFELTSGLAAILALFHDVLVTASVVLICRIQINVAFIAALITILGYSINNTIIIFDRMRDDLKVARNSGEKISNTVVANNAVKSTMMRSLLTGITTFIMIFFITVIGVADIQEFAFPIMIGILAGFYSSVFLTPGLWAIGYRPRKRKKTKNASNKQQEAENKTEVA